mmetsp:Transcript_139248/g.277641  ORF Transcript_139248/g.277641 Transcript_139248/m.277641 type:complete len:85 (+) Transcript_139248:864-1118(+)
MRCWHIQFASGMVGGEKGLVLQAWRPRLPRNILRHSFQLQGWRFKLGARLGSKQKAVVLQTRAGRMLCGINNRSIFKLRLPAQI